MLKSPFFPNVDFKALERVQKILAGKAVFEDRFSKPIRRVSGVDVAFKDGMSYAAAITLELPDMRRVEVQVAVAKPPIPYRPGFLAFRELPSTLKAVRRLKSEFDVLLCNGHGLAHPRFCGLATHLGVVLKAPTVGVASAVLREFKYREPRKVGEAYPIQYRGKIVGYALLSKPGCKPIFVSPGNMVSLESSVRIVSSCLRGFKFPEPLRLAHIESVRAKRGLTDMC